MATASYAIATTNFVDAIYTWVNPPGLTTITNSSSGNINNVNININLVGTNPITVTAQNGCGTAANIVNLVLGKVPVIKSVNGPRTFCGTSPTNATFTAISATTIPNATFTWLLPAGVSFASTNTSTSGSSIDVIIASNAFSANGILSIHVTESTASCSTSNDFRIDLYAAAKPIAINGLNQICNIPTTIYSTPVLPNVTSYNWVVPTGMTILSGQGTNQITVTINSTIFTSGTISVTATYADCGTSLPTTTTVTLLAAPKLISGPSAICGTVLNQYNQSGTLIGTFPNRAVYSITPVVGATSYTWTVPSGATIISASGISLGTNISGSGITSIVVQFDINILVSGTISVYCTYPCGNSSPSTLVLKRNGDVITGPKQVCGLITANYSIPSTATNINWTLPSGVTLVSPSIASNPSINVSFQLPFCDTSPITVAYKSECNINEVLTLTVRCNDYTKIDTTDATVFSNPNTSAATVYILNTYGAQIKGTAPYSAETAINFVPSGYSFRITPVDNSFTPIIGQAQIFTNIYGKIQIPSFIGWRYGSKYSIEVAYIKTDLQGNPLQLPYGCPVIVQMPMPATTKLTNCAATVSNLHTAILADWVYGATMYKFEITKVDSITNLPIIGNNPFYVYDPNKQIIPASGYANLAAGFKYLVRVAISQDTSGPKEYFYYYDYGPTTCTITIPSGTTKMNIIKDDWSVKYSENPFENYFNVTVNSISKATIAVAIYDINGRLLESIEDGIDRIQTTRLGENLASGVYLVTVKQDDNTESFRMIKK